MSARTRWLSLSTLALLPLVWLWPCVFGGHTFVPQDPAQFPPASIGLSDAELQAARAGTNGDVTEVWPWLLPQMGLAREELARGNLPGWDPHARTGAPLHETAVLGVFYPPHWLWMFGPSRPQDVLVFLTWISLALAGLFTFGLLRAVGLGAAAAWFGAAAYELSGTMATNGYFFTRLPALAWLPGLLWAIYRFGQGPHLRRGPMLGIAAAFALPWFAGFPPYATANALIGAALAARMLLERLGRDGSAAAIVLLRRYALAFAIGILCTMPQVLPAVWFYGSEGARTAGPSLAITRGAAFETYGLLGYLMPDAFGHPIHAPDLPYHRNPLCYLWGDITAADGRAANPNFNYTEYTVFTGAATFVLAAYGAVRGRMHLRWFLLLGLGCLLATALQWPGFRLLYVLPGVANVAPMRWLSPATLFVVWLAAIGFDRLQLVERRSRLRAAMFAGLVAAAAGFASGLPASWHRTDPEWPARPIAERFGIPLADAIAYFRDPAGGDRFLRACEQLQSAGLTAAVWFAVVAILLAAHGLVGDRRPRLRAPLALGAGLTAILQLVMHGAPLTAGHQLTHDTDTPVHAFLRERAAATADAGGFTFARAGDPPALPIQLPPGQLMDMGIRDLQFYTHYDARSIEPLRRVLGAAFAAEHAASGYLKATLPDAALTHPLLDLYGVRYVLATQPLANAGRRVGPEFRGRGEFFVYERPHPLPRAFTVPALRVLPDDEALLAAMADPAARFLDQAFTTAELAPPAAAAAAAAAARSVRFARDEPRCIELDVGAGTAPWLVLTDTWFPGWTATIDGQPVPMYRCNHCQRLLALPAGPCRVRFQHTPPLLPTGLCLFGLGVGLAGFALRRRRPAASSTRATADETGS